MTNTTAQDTVKKLLSQFNEANRQFFSSEVTASTDEDSIWFEEDELEALSNLRTNGLTWEHIDEHGGEGQGEEYWAVYKFKHDDFAGDVFVKFDGSYQSYDGSTYDDFYIVTPVERMVTFYE